MADKTHKWDFQFVSCEVATVFSCEECGAIRVVNRYNDSQYTSKDGDFSEKEPPCPSDEEID